MILLSSGLAQESKDRTAQVKQEEEVDYHTKWLKEDVRYIISNEERAIFRELTTPDEKEQFIEQFWFRRDPDPRTANNEFKEEHYRRIAYANERFPSGDAGWETDRGRIYIMFGPPAEIEAQPAGGKYFRKAGEGGGSTSVYPFERWRYQYIEGVGEDVEIEFVDQSMTGEYRMAMNPGEKDALMNIPGAGLTRLEKMGLSEKAERPYFTPTASYDSPYGRLQAKDRPFARMERYFNLQRPPKIQFADLKDIVTTNVRYSQLPYKMRTSFIRLSEDKVLVLVTVEIENRDLQFTKEVGLNRAVVNVYGLVTSLSGRTMAEFESSIPVQYSDERLEQGRQSRSMYQKIMALPPGQRFKLDLVLKDSQSGQAGVVSRGIVVPKYGSTELEASSIILANSITPVPTNSDYLEQYVVGDLKIQPNVTSEYLPGQTLTLYLQIYNVAIDQASLEPQIQISYALKSNGKVVRELGHFEGETVQFFSTSRLVVVDQIPLQSILPGKYELEVKVTDQIGNKSLVTRADFTVN
jgi:GWxTD domain-containing protein